jgi:hypothetical protein
MATAWEQGDGHINGVDSHAITASVDVDDIGDRLQSLLTLVRW